MQPPVDFLGNPEHFGGRSASTFGPLARLTVQHDGYVCPSFRRKLNSYIPEMRVMWNRMTRRYVFYRSHISRTGIGRAQDWHDPENWYGSTENLEERALLRATLAQDLRWRSMGLVPIMEWGPEQGPLDERVILRILLGDSRPHSGVIALADRIQREAESRQNTDNEFDRVDTSLFRKAVSHADSPMNRGVDVNERAKLYRDDRNTEMGLRGVPFTTGAPEPPISVAVPK